MSRAGPDAAEQERAETAAQRKALQEAEEREAEQAADLPATDRSNSQRAALAARGMDPGGPPSDRPDEVVDIPSAPAAPPVEDDVEPLLLGDPDWRPPPPPAARPVDLTGWVTTPTLPPDVRAAWRRRAGLHHDHPRGADPGVAALGGPSATTPTPARWLRAVGLVLADDPTASVLLAEALTPTAAWVGRGSAARLDAGRVALAQLALTLSPARTVHAHVHTALDGVPDEEAAVAASGARFPGAARLLGLPDAPQADPRRDAEWVDELAARLGPEVLTYTGPTADDDTTRRALAEHGLTLARAIGRLRVRTAALARALLRVGSSAPGVAVHVARRVDVDTDLLLVGLRELGRGLHHTPRLATADAIVRVRTLAEGWAVARAAAAATLSALATPGTRPARVPPHVVSRALAAGDRRAALAALPADATLARWVLDPSSPTPRGGLADHVVPLLAGASPDPHPDAPALAAVIGLDRLDAGVSLGVVLDDAVAALTPSGAAGALELLLAGVHPPAR